MYESVAAATAAEHRHSLRREAYRDHLATLATCCKPGNLRRTATSVLHWLRAGQLQGADCLTC